MHHKHDVDMQLEHFIVNRIDLVMKVKAGVITRDCIYSALARVESANLLGLAERRAPREEIPTSRGPR